MVKRNTKFILLWDRSEKPVRSCWLSLETYETRPSKDVALVPVLAVGIRGVPDREAGVVNLKLRIKSWMCYHGFGDWLIEFCNDCGVRQPLSWWANEELWLKVNGESGGALCPKCFDRGAFSNHGLSIRWKQELAPVHFQ